MIVIKCYQIKTHEGFKPLRETMLVNEKIICTFKDVAELGPYKIYEEMPKDIVRYLKDNHIKFDSGEMSRLFYERKLDLGNYRFTIEEVDDEKSAEDINPDLKDAVNKFNLASNFCTEVDRMALLLSHGLMSKSELASWIKELALKVHKLENK